MKIKVADRRLRSQMRKRTEWFLCIFLSWSGIVFAQPGHPPEGIVLFRQQYYADAAQADVAEYTDLRTDYDGALVFTFPDGSTHEYAKVLYVGRIAYPNLQLFQNVRTINELDPLKQELERLTRQMSRFPQTAKYLKSYLDALRQECALFNEGKVKYLGRWVTQDGLRKQLELEKQFAEAQRTLRLEQERNAKDSMVAKQIAEEELRRIAEVERKEKERQEERQKLAEAQRLAEAQKAGEARLAEAQKEVTSTVKRPKSGTFATWTMASDGYSWNAAPESAKQQLCRALAANSRHGNSTAFFYDALGTFYDSTDPVILRTSLDDITRLTEAASTTLPRNRTNY